MLIAGALLLLAGAIGAFYFWKATERQVRAGGGTAAHRGGLGGGGGGGGRMGILLTRWMKRG